MMLRSDKEVEEYKKHLLELQKLKQEIKLLDNQNNDFKATKLRANIAIIISGIAIIIEIIRLISS